MYELQLIHSQVLSAVGNAVIVGQRSNFTVLLGRTSYKAAS